MLSKQRNEIDMLDKQIITLLEQRLDCAKEIAEIKATQQKAIFDPKREKILLEKINRLTQNTFYQPYILAIYQKILVESKTYQQTIIDSFQSDDIE